jgi:phosphoglycerate dehydrogenase-like enzyme
VKLLSHMSRRVDEYIKRAEPDVEIVPLPTDGPILQGTQGDVLVTYRRAVNIVDAASAVPWVHIIGTGIESVPPQVFGAGRVVTTSRGYGAIPVAEYAMAAIITFEKHFPAVFIHEPPSEPRLPIDVLEAGLEEGKLVPGDDFLNDSPQRWGWAWMGEVAGKTLAIVGLGGIGTAIARRASAFEMNVIAMRYRYAPSPVPGVKMTGSLPELLGCSDHIVLCAPLTAATHSLIDAAAFAQCKPGAHLINVSRGALVDEEALLYALDSGRLALATLDVSVVEPLPGGHPFYTHPRIRLSPHVSWAGPRVTERSLDILIDNLRRARRGDPLEGVVDQERGY